MPTLTGPHADRIYVLAMDHRTSFANTYQREGESNETLTSRLADGKDMMLDGLEVALRNGANIGQAAVLVDERFGDRVAARARELGVVLMMPVEKSMSETFELEYGPEFAAHVEKYAPDVVKALVFYNPGHTEEHKTLQRGRLRELSRWCRSEGHTFLLELLVPPTEAQLAIAGNAAAYDTGMRPDLTSQAIGECYDAGIEPHIWKLEGYDDSGSCAQVAAQCQVDDRDGVRCLILGRGAGTEQVDHWLRQAAPVAGFSGFAIGRSLWAQPVADYLEGRACRREAAKQVARNYLHYCNLYDTAAGRSV